MVTLMQNLNDIDLLEAQLELESLGITDALSEPEHTDVSEQKSIGTLKNGIVLIENKGKNDRGYLVYEAICPFCGKLFEDSRDRLSARGHCGCQTYERRAKASAKGLAVRLNPKLKRPARKPYDPNHVPLEKSMSPEEKAGWTAYLNQTMKPGGLAMYVGMPQSHREVLASLIAHDYGKVFEALEYLLKDLFIELLDLCQSERVEFPTRGEIRRRIAFIRLWERFKSGQTPNEIAFELCDDTWRIVDLLKRLQTELRDFHRRDTYGLNDWYGGEGVLNMEIAENTRVVLI